MLTYTLQTILDHINYVTNKEQFGNTLTIPALNIIFRGANIEVFKKIYEKYEISQNNTDSIAPFKCNMGEGTPPLFINEYGQSQLPKDYAHLDVGGIYYLHLINNEDEEYKDNCGRIKLAHKTGNKIEIRPVTIVKDYEWNIILSDANKKPTLWDPICKEENNYLQFKPNNLKMVNFHYIRKPKTPVYIPKYDLETLSYTMDNSSTQFEFIDEDYPLIIYTILKIIAPNLKEANLLQYSNLKEQEINK